MTDADDQVYERLAHGDTPAEIMHSMGLTHAEYYSVLKSLTASGILSQFEDLPPEAIVELCPPPDITSVMEVLGIDLDNIGLGHDVVSRVKSLCVRYGLVRPVPHDTRYNRSRWTGQTVRRVDFTYGDSAYMVCGFLAPRMDKKPWNRATPQYRTVRVERNDGVIRHLAWDTKRGAIVNVLDVQAHCAEVLSHSGQTIQDGELSALTLAVAYVCESRALLAHKVSKEASE